eukprot:8415134-Heterocapsa_arctica.AAC.1
MATCGDALKECVEVRMGTVRADEVTDPVPRVVRLEGPEVLERSQVGHSLGPHGPMLDIGRIGDQEVQAQDVLEADLCRGVHLLPTKPDTCRRGVVP